MILLFCRYKDKPSIMKYIKVAATLPDKTVRDVALRCRWMTVKLSPHLSMCIKEVVTCFGLHYSSIVSTHVKLNDTFDVD